MKRQALLILLTLLTTFAFAQPARQDTTTIYINPGFNKDPMRSKWVSKVEQKGDLWELNLFDKKDVLREKISFEDKKLAVRKGPYAFYENSFVKEEGNYDKGYKHGLWKYYYPNQQLLESVNYAWDKFNGLYVAYWDSGELKKEGAYTRGNKIGNWKMFYKNKKLALNEDYDNMGNLIDGIYFDEMGNSVKKVYIMQAPSYPGGMDAFYQFLSKTIRYPTKFTKNKLEGKVELEFTVMKDGSLEDVKVKESTGAEFGNEALRVFKYARNWVPAQELGEPVRMRHTVLIKFSHR